ncbi:MAG: tetratricopeptide repeat protein [Tannerellaceae bacterium]|jgi:tetratricopeptide (TPR) repeat protein|nr:tetratricopeptide repeat protein [Tannerellaceae bacterium]
MKKLVYVFLAVYLACIIFFACTKGVVVEELVRAEKQMEANPDSALILLEEIKKNNGDSLISETLSKKQYALWCLLLTQAQDKNNIAQTSDSLIRIAVDYFEKKNDKPHLMKACYYNAVIYHDLGDSPHAQEYYLKALNAGKESADHAMLGRIYANLGSMYSYQNLTKEAKDCQEKALEHILITNDTMNIAMVSRNLGRIYTNSNHPDSAIGYYLQAIPFLTKQNRSSIYNEIGGIYKRLEQYPEAFKYINLALNSLTKKMMPLTIYCNLGDLYRQTGQYDSAYYYLSLCLTSPNIYTKAGANLSLSLLEEKNKNWEANARYQKQYRLLQDTINQTERTENLQHIQSLYNYRQVENERVYHKIKSQQKTIHINILTIGFVFVFAVGFLYYQRKKRLYKEQLDKERRIREQKEKQSSSVIKEKEEEIRKLIELSEQKPANQKEELAIRQQILENEVVRDKKDSSLRKQLNRAFKKSSLWQSLVSRQNIPTEGEWVELNIQMEEIYTDMAHYLKQTEIDNENVRLCYLLKAGLHDRQTGVLLNLSSTALSKRKSRLHKKLTNEKGSAKGLDLFLKETFECFD